MVCADDTILNDWVDVAHVVPEINMMAPLTNAELTPLKEELKMDDDAAISLALRQKRQQEAQLAFLKEQGLSKGEKDEKEEQVEDIKEESADSPKDSCEAAKASTEEATSEAKADVYTQARNAARKAGVAAAGGTLVAVGAILTPLPTPGGILLAGAGLGVLSTEFESAKKVLDCGKEKLVGLIDSIPEEEDNIEVEEISMVDSQDSEDSVFSDVSRTTTISRASSTVSQKGDVRASIQGRARRIGKSIRPFLTDEDAPRQAMEELNASTKRAYTRASGKVNDFVSFMFVLDQYDPVKATTNTTRSPLAQQVSTVETESTCESTEANEESSLSEQLGETQ